MKRSGKPREKGGESIRMMNGVVYREKYGENQRIFMSLDLVEERAKRVWHDPGSS